MVFNGCSFSLVVFQATNILFYEDIAFSILELQHKRIVKVNWVNLAVQEVAQHMVLVPIDGTVHDVLEQLERLVERGELQLETRHRQLRMIGLYNTAVHKIFRPEETILYHLPEIHTNAVRCEEIPDEEFDAPEGSRVLCVVHYSKLQAYPVRFGHPFSLMVGKAETVAEVRHRIRSRLNERFPVVAVSVFA
jgi:ubiquitin carboxyl-terminal hydrolase 7